MPASSKHFTIQFLAKIPHYHLTMTSSSLQLCPAIIMAALRNRAGHYAYYAY